MATLAVIDRPVANVEAENALIAALLCEPSIIDRAADVLKPDQFADAFLGFVFETIIRESARGKPVNAFTIRPFLEKEPAFEQIGGASWLADLGAAQVTSLAAIGNARQIADLSRRRHLIEGLRETIAAAADCEQPVEDLIAKADEALSSARDREGAKGEFSAADCLQMVIDGFDQSVSGVTCGNILSLDQLLGPLRPGQLVIGAGRPGMGKSLTAQSYALGAANKGHGVLFISLEMGAEELGERMAADVCFDAHRIPHDAIRDKKLSADQRRTICRAKDYIAGLPVQVIDRPGITAPQLRAVTKRWQRRFEARGKSLDLVIVDYLQRMGGKGDAYERISEISRSAKDIAKECGVAMFALAQLSRKVEERADKRPNLADLRDSGQIEQDADTVLFFLREEYYLRQSEPTDPEKRETWEKALEQCRGRIEFICAKRRGGTTGSLTGQFLAPYQAVRG